MQQSTEIKMDDGLNISIGDIFYASWGYDQTNIDFVKVISISPSGKTVKAVGIGKRAKQTGFMTEDVIPDPDNVTSEPVTLKLDLYTGGEKPERTLRGSYFYTQGYKHLKTLWKYKHALYQSHYA